MTIRDPNRKPTRREVLQAQMHALSKRPTPANLEAWCRIEKELRELEDRLWLRLAPVAGTC